MQRCVQTGGNKGTDAKLGNDPDALKDGEGKRQLWVIERTATQNVFLSCNVCVQIDVNDYNDPKGRKTIIHENGFKLILHI